MNHIIENLPGIARGYKVSGRKMRARDLEDFHAGGNQRSRRRERAEFLKHYGAKPVQRPVPKRRCKQAIAAMNNDGEPRNRVARKLYTKWCAWNLLAQDDGY